VAGSPIGSPSFVQTFGSKTAEVVMSKVEELVEIPLELQHKHLLLPLSMVPRLTYLMRTGPLDPVAGSIDASVREAARVIQQAGADTAGPFATRMAEMQLGLPLRLGGCGLPTPTPTLSAAARLSSVALTLAALRQGPAIFRAFDGPQCAILQQTWETSKTTAADLCSLETATLQAALEHSTLAKEQHSFGHHKAQCAYKALLRTADSFSPTTPMLVLSRLRSVACRAAPAWLETLPTTPLLRLDDGAFRTALPCCLGESNLPSGSPDATCFCRTSLSATDAEHALTCRSPNALCVLRHDDIVDVVRRMLHWGGVQ
jgi:hypothetical protein